MKKALLLLPFAFAVSCQPKAEESAAGDPAPPAAEEKPATVLDPAKPETLVGSPLEKVEAACEKAEVPYRVVMVNGEGRPITMDMRPERLNLTVEDGVVTKITNG